MAEHTSTLGAVHKVRRVGNVLFTRCFAEVFLRLMPLNDSRLRRCMDLFQTHIQLSGNELGLLVPEHPKTMHTPQLYFSFWSVVACCLGGTISSLQYSAGQNVYLPVFCFEGLISEFPKFTYRFPSLRASFSSQVKKNRKPD